MAANQSHPPKHCSSQSDPCLKLPRYFQNRQIRNFGRAKAENLEKGSTSAGHGSPFLVSCPSNCTHLALLRIHLRPWRVRAELRLPHHRLEGHVPLHLALPLRGRRRRTHGPPFLQTPLGRQLVVDGTDLTRNCRTLQSR